MKKSLVSMKKKKIKLMREKINEMQKSQKLNDLDTSSIRME